jgi:hypothetical protein
LKEICEAVSALLYATTFKEGVAYEKQSEEKTYRETGGII